MLCQYCHQQEAAYRFFYNYNGLAGDVHLCAGCAASLYNQYQEYMNLRFGHWKTEPAQSDAAEQAQPNASQWEAFFSDDTLKAMDNSSRIPADAGEEIKLRRKLGELRAQLRKAVSAEEYEFAARLRDEIASAENKVTP